MKPAEPMHYSGVVVLARPGALDGCAAEIDSIDGVDVRLRDESRGRLIAVLESRDAQGQEDLLERIRRAESVMGAALVYHYVDPGAGEAPDGEPDGGSR